MDDKVSKQEIDFRQSARRDIGNLLFHFTSGGDALERLKSILKDGKLQAGLDCIEEEVPYICFTEAPISEMVAYFALKKQGIKMSEVSDYEPYGIAVEKEWFYEKGGRHVIYDDHSMKGLLPKELRYKHKYYDPRDKEKDASWEREWRIPKKELILDPDKTLIIVPDVKAASYVRIYVLTERIQTLASNPEKTQQEPELSSRSTGNANESDVNPQEPWYVVSLDLFGVKLNRST